MGCIRLLLAAAVVMVHTNGLPLIGGKNAVQCFYLISGFLISYVLVEKRAYASTSHFYINRALRLYPIYFYVGLLSLTYYLVAWVIGFSSAPIEIFFSQVPFSTALLLVFSNVALFLQDWLLFLDVDDGTLSFTANYAVSEIPLMRGSLVPQTWSLGLELSFYLLAPFVVVRKPLLFALLLSSIAIKGWLWHTGLGIQDVWSYKFFPAELSLFLAGAVSHQFLSPWYRRVLQPSRLAAVAIIVTIALVLFVLAYPLIPVREWMKSATLQAAFFLALPLLFTFQAAYLWDRAAGDLSYPLYICHGLVIKVTTFWLAVIGLLEPWLLTVIVLPVSLLMAHQLNVRVAEPVERIRNRFRTAPGS